MAVSGKNTAMLVLIPLAGAFVYRYEVGMLRKDERLVLVMKMCLTITYQRVTTLASTSLNLTLEKPGV